jgi:CheY-like chemotaxis protein
MLCPVCLTRIDLAGKVPSAAAPAVVAPQPVPHEVVCPRCKLHFSPFSKRSRPSPTDASRRKTVLVVDDQKYFREIARDALEAAFDVKTAASAHEARVAIGAGGIDLLVLDLKLDGCEAGRDLLLTLRPKPCPIILFTGQDESEMYGHRWEELESMGADELVIKGMNAGESLLRKVAVLLGTSFEELEERRPIG